MLISSKKRIVRKNSRLKLAALILALLILGLLISSFDDVLYLGESLYSFYWWGMGAW